MIVNLQTEHHLEFLSLKEAAEAGPSLHVSKYHFIGNLMPRLDNYCQKLFIIESSSDFTSIAKEPRARQIAKNAW